MTTPNLDATQHCWVESLVRFTFSIEHQREWDNAAVDDLSQVTSKLDVETMKSILNRVTMVMTERADAHDLAVAEADEEIHGQSQETAVLARATHVHVKLHVTDWVTTQQEDPILSTLIEWISNQKVQDLKHLLGDNANTEEGKAILQEQKKANALPRSPLPLPHTGQQIGGSFADCGPHGSLNCCHKWMSPRCWTPGSAANPVLAT